MTTKTGIGFLFAVLAAILLAPLGGSAQVTTAIFHGTVVDPSGAAVAGAQVKVTDEDSGLVTPATTNERGEFLFAALRPGHYGIAIQAAGFKQHTESGIVLAGGQRVRLVFNLQIGEVTDTVEVTADRVLLNTVNAEQRGYVSSREAQELPKINRDWSNLLITSGAGIAPYLAGSAGVVMNGLPSLGIYFTVDGTSADQDTTAPGLFQYQNINLIPGISLDAVEEVNVSKGVTSSESPFTMTGGINITSKRGGNAFHGSLFLLNETENLNARDVFLRTKANKVYNQFGGSVGGPIIRDKLFFFTTYEGYRLRAFTPISGDVPTQELRSLATAAVPAYKPFFDFFDLPTQPYAPGSNTGLYLSAGSQQLNDNTLMVRSDYHLRSDTIITGRWQRMRPFRLQPSLAARNPQTWDAATDMGSASVTHMKPTWTVETRFGINKTEQLRVHEIYRQGQVPIIRCCLGWTESGETRFAGGNVVSLTQHLSLNRGRHSLKLGGNLLKRKQSQEEIEVPGYSYNTVADLLANRASQGRFTYGRKFSELAQWEYGMFVQDDFKLRRDLVLTFGLRYDYQTRPGVTDDRVFNWASPPGFFGAGVLLPPSDPYAADKNNFSPRAGFAWTVGSSQKTVIRGGAGMMHNRINLRAGISGTVLNGPDEPFRFIFSAQEVAANNIKWPDSNATTLPIVKQLGLVQGGVISDQIENPYSMQWSLFIEREIGTGMVFETGYAGSRGVKLIMQHRPNQPDRATGIRPYPQYSDYNWADGSDSSRYHAWQTSLRKRFAKGLLFNAHYTFSNSYSYFIGDIRESNQDVPQDEGNLRAEGGPSPYDIRHRFSANSVYELFADRLSATSGLRRLLLAGWQIGGVFNWQSGFPLNVTQASTRANSRPDTTGQDPYLPDWESTLRWLDRAAFVNVPTYSSTGQPIRPGNLGKRSLRGPGLVTLDLSLAKNLKFTEAVNFQIRADLLNSLNHTNFNNISSQTTSGSFGQIIGAAPARIVQLNLRLTF